MSLSLDKSAWTRVALGDVAAASREKADPSDGSIERYIAGEHMDTDDLKLHRWGDVGQVDLGPAFHRRFRPGQVLYGSRRTYLRKVAVADFDGVCANTTFVVETKDERVLLQTLLPFIMSSEPFHAFAIAESKGSVNPYVNWSDIERYELDLPPLDEQRRIADLLWAVEGCIDGERSLRDTAATGRRVWLDAHVAQFVEARSAPFSRIWARSPESGWSASPVDHVTGRFVLSLAAVGPEGYRPGNLKCIPDTDQARKATLRRGDLLISRANTVEAVGRAGIYTEDRNDVSFPDTMMRLSLADSVDARFALAVIASAHGRTHMRRVAAGSATSMVKINRSSLGSMPFPVVPLRLQRQLLAEVQRFDSAIASLEATMDTLMSTRSSLLCEIFGGD